MTFDEWLDEPQTLGATRRSRLHKANKFDRARREWFMLEWLRAAWNAGIEHKTPVDLDG